MFHSAETSSKVRVMKVNRFRNHEATKDLRLWNLPNIHGDLIGPVGRCLCDTPKRKPHGLGKHEYGYVSPPVNYYLDPFPK